MRGWQVTELGEPSKVLTLTDLPDPTPAAGQLVVRVLAAAANFPDVLMCRGLYQVRPPLPFTPGVELCGEVVAVGPEVTSVVVGDRVLGPPTAPGGSFAELALMDATDAFTVPAGLSDAQAAALFIGHQTSWFALHRRTQVHPGDVVLVHAAAGGVGSSAVQLAKAAGATVVGVVGGPAKVEFARRLGADVVVDRHTEDFVLAVNDLTNGRGADIIYDPVGGDAYRRSTKCIAFEGSIVVIGFAGGEIQSAALNHPLIKNYSVVGLHWGLYRQRDPRLVDHCHDELTRLIESGHAVIPQVSEIFGLEDVPTMLQRLADGDTTGRVAMVAAT